MQPPLAQKPPLLEEVPDRAEESLVPLEKGDARQGRGIIELAAHPYPCHKLFRNIRFFKKRLVIFRILWYNTVTIFCTIQTNSYAGQKGNAQQAPDHLQALKKKGL